MSGVKASVKAREKADKEKADKEQTSLRDLLSSSGPVKRMSKEQRAKLDDIELKLAQPHLLPEERARLKRLRDKELAASEDDSYGEEVVSNLLSRASSQRNC